jgi:hypothetical protein
VVVASEPLPRPLLRRDSSIKGQYIVKFREERLISTDEVVGDPEEESMKAVYEGGPEHGNVADLKPTTFGVSFIREVFADDVIQSRRSHKYLFLGKKCKHFCKPKGLTKVLEYQGASEEAIDAQGAKAVKDHLDSVTYNNPLYAPKAS